MKARIFSSLLALAAFGIINFSFSGVANEPEKPTPPASLPQLYDGLKDLEKQQKRVADEINKQIEVEKKSLDKEEEDAKREFAWKMSLLEKELAQKMTLLDAKKKSLQEIKDHVSKSANERDEEIALEKGYESLKAYGVNWQTMTKKAEEMYQFECTLPNPQSPQFSLAVSGTGKSPFAALRKVLDEIERLKGDK